MIFGNIGWYSLSYVHSPHPVSCFWCIFMAVLHHRVQAFWVIFSVSVWMKTFSRNHTVLTWLFLEQQIKRLFLKSIIPARTRHSISAVVQLSMGGKVRKAVSVRVIQRAGKKKPNLDLIGQKNKVASFCCVRDRDSFWVTGGNSSLSTHW